MGESVEGQNERDPGKNTFLQEKEHAGFGPYLRFARSSKKQRFEVFNGQTIVELLKYHSGQKITRRGTLGSCFGHQKHQKINVWEIVIEILLCQKNSNSCEKRLKDEL